MWSSNGGRVASGTRGLSPARGAEPLQPAAGGGAPKPKLCDRRREGPSGSSRSAARRRHGPGAHDTAGGTAVRVQSRAFWSSCSRVRHTGCYWRNAKNSPDRDSKAPIDSARAATAASRAPAPTRPGGASKKGKGNGEGFFFFSFSFYLKNMNCRLSSQPGESAAPAGSQAAMPPAPVITVLAPSRF